MCSYIYDLSTKFWRETSLSKSSCYLTLCVPTYIIYRQDYETVNISNYVFFSSEIDFLEDLAKDPSKGLLKDNGEMYYCYQSKNSPTNMKLEISTHVRDHLVNEMQHSSFIIAVEIRVKETKGKKRRKVI